MWAIFLKFLTQREIKDDMQLGGRIIVGERIQSHSSKEKDFYCLGACRF